MSNSNTNNQKRKMSKGEWRVRHYPFTVALLVLGILFGSLSVVSLYTSVTTGYHFDQKIGGYLYYAESAPTFNQISSNLNKAEIGINETFQGNQTTTYNSPFYWDHYYTHSVTSYIAYINSIQERIAIYNATYTDMIHNSSSVIQLQDWYQNNINTIHDLITMNKRGGGGLYQGLENIYFVNVSGSFAYWLGFLLLFSILSCVFSILIMQIENGRISRRERYEELYH